MIRKFPSDRTIDADKYGELTREINRLVYKIRFDLEELNIKQLKQVEELVEKLKGTK